MDTEQSPLTYGTLFVQLRHCLETTHGEAGWQQFANIGLMVSRGYRTDERGDFGNETAFTLGLKECWVHRDAGEEPYLLYRVADREKFIEAVCKLHGRERVFQALLEMETGA